MHYALAIGSLEVRPERKLLAVHAIGCQRLNKNKTFYIRRGFLRFEISDKRANREELSAVITRQFVDTEKFRRANTGALYFYLIPLSHDTFSLLSQRKLS